ncbi:MAG: glycerol-3-phosphate acyltransferase [Calditrichaeota bacterium]|nr:MAG: glycerol-3-phosphate acyltransferase [Calditrichota bacterium]
MGRLVMAFESILIYGAVGIGAYLSGSLPSAWLVMRLRDGTDIRTRGSGNVGALNTYRSSHSPLSALIVLFLDVLKGWLPPALLMYYGFADNLMFLFAGIGVILGHCYPVWLRFHGGRGLAVSAGFFGAVAPLVILVWGLVWLLYFILIRKHIVANLVATFLLPLIVYFTGDKFFAPHILLLTLAMMFIVFLKHLERLPDVIFGNPYEKKES